MEWGWELGRLEMALTTLSLSACLSVPCIVPKGYFGQMVGGHPAAG